MEKDNEPEQNCDSVSETKETTSSSNEPQSDATINLLPPEPQESPLEPKYTAEELLIMQLEKLEGWALKRYLRREKLLPEELDDPYHEDDDLEGVLLQKQLDSVSTTANTCLPTPRIPTTIPRTNPRSPIGPLHLALCP
jgi:hypothetical protein